jgi:hypothetical protein
MTATPIMAAATLGIAIRAGEVGGEARTLMM